MLSLRKEREASRVSSLAPRNSMDSNTTHRRVSMKTHSPNWKEKLRRNCLKRAQEGRAHLIWKIRSSSQAQDQKNIVQSALRDIVSDELKKIKDSSYSNQNNISTAPDEGSLWEYEGMQVDRCQDECEKEDVLIEMEKLLYEDLRKELLRRALDDYEEEEEYLAQAVNEQLQINDVQNCQTNRVWCPVCKQGELTESHHLICCTRCKLQLDVEGDKMNLNILRDRLGQVYEEHLNRGCRATPSFCMEARFSITALYIQCQACNTFDVVL